MNQYPPNPQHPYPPQYPNQQAYPPQGQGPWQGQGQPPVGPPPPSGSRKLVGVLLVVAVTVLPVLCCLGAYVEGRETTKGPGEEVATTAVRVGEPATVTYQGGGLVRRRYSVWLRHLSATSDVRAQVDCQDTSPAGYGQSFPASTFFFEPEPGVVWIGGSMFKGTHTITCEARVNAPADYSGRLVITEHVLRPSDILGL